MSGLKPASRALVVEAFAVLKERESGYEDGEDSLPEWISGGGMFVLENRRLRRFESCLQSELFRLPETTRTKTFRAALRADTRIAHLIGKLVGTPNAATLLEEDSFGRSLTRRVARRCEGFCFDSEAFDRAYTEWLSEHSAKTRRVRFFATLHPFAFGGCVDLGHGVRIDQLSDDEVRQLFGDGRDRVDLSRAGTGNGQQPHCGADRMERAVWPP